MNIGDLIVILALVFFCTIWGYIKGVEEGITKDDVIQLGGKSCILFETDKVIEKYCLEE